MSKKSKSDLKVLLAGSEGKMGRAIQDCAADARVKIAAKVGGDAEWTKVDAKSADVVIDFSSPEGLTKAIQWCVKNAKPLVSGTTGLTKKEWAALNAAAKKIPILYSGNMSLGIAVVNAMMKNFAAIADWDFQIEEVHHNRKKDKPSGTALLIQEKLTNAVGRPLPPALSLRGGGVPGIHTVFAMGQDEIVTVQHTAFNRQVFARGALRASRWLFDKGAPGLYDLSDLYTVD